MRYFVRHALTVLGLILLVVGPAFGQDQDENLVVNPEFTNSPDPVTSPRGSKLGGGSTILRLETGSRDIAGWTVAKGDVWLGGAPWTPRRFVVLSDEGVLTQTITTVPGKEYELRFQMRSGSDPPSKKDVRVTAGTTSRIFVIDGSDSNQDDREQVFTFTAKAARTPLKFTTSVKGFGHHGPLIRYVFVRLYDPQRDAMKAEIERAYSAMYSARERRDFEKCFSYLAPDCEKQRQNGEKLDRSAWQALVRNTRLPEGNAGFTTRELRQVTAAKGSKNVDVIFIERYTYTKYDRERKLRKIVLVWVMRDVWSPTPGGWKLSRSKDVGYEIYVDGKRAESIP